MDKSKPQITPDQLSTLQYLAELLHLFQYRNKNQHRRSTWWRHFSLFRRQLNDFVEDFESLNQVPKTHLERTRKVTQDKSTRTKLSQRIELWQDVLVPKWHNSFSQLVADPRFAMLGVVMLAILSQACSILGITAAYDELGQAEVEGVLDEFGQEYWSEKAQVDTGDDQTDDLGEVVAREDDAPATTPQALQQGAGKDAEDALQAPPERRDGRSDGMPRPKKNKKRNAIDDLFSGLD